jgi:hypothetical protein
VETLVGPVCRQVILAFALACPRLAAQITTTLQPRTVQQFEKYADTVEQQLNERWSGRRPFLAIDQSPQDKAKVLEGEMLIRPGSATNPINVSNGLIHDWLGDVFIPNTSVAAVLAILEEYNRHHEIYPEIIQSRLLERKGNDLKGYWRLERKSPLLTIDLDVHQDAHYEEIAPGKWICRAYAKDISELDNPGTRFEKTYSPGHGSGFLWRLYAYWSLQEMDGGVLAENRNLSLSRDIPLAIAWMIKPFVQEVPRQSLESTLKNTRKAVASSPAN